MTKRQRKDLETAWKKERNELQKQLLHSQQFIKDLQKQSSQREAPIHLTEKINILLTENELLLNKIKELESVVDNVQTLRAEVQRLRDKNSSDWNYWRKQQSDLYAQLRQQHNIKESILLKFDRLQRQVNSRTVRCCFATLAENVQQISFDLFPLPHTDTHTHLLQHRRPWMFICEGYVTLS